MPGNSINTVATAAAAKILDLSYSTSYLQLQGPWRALILRDHVARLAALYSARCSESCVEATVIINCPGRCSNHCAPCKRTLWLCSGVMSTHFEIIVVGGGKSNGVLRGVLKTRVLYWVNFAHLCRTEALLIISYHQGLRALDVPLPLPTKGIMLQYSSDTKNSSLWAASSG